MAEDWHGRFCWYELMTTDPKAEPADPSASAGLETEPAPLDISWRELATTDREGAMAYPQGAAFALHQAKA